MSAVLRVKRKKDDEPLDALLISGKRLKTECDETVTSTPLTAIVKFAGTIEKEEDSVIEHITKVLSRDDLRINFKQRIVDITKKAREETKQDSKDSRYKIVNSIRSLDTSMIEDLEEDIINIIDVEDTKAIPDNDSNANYVYDLYYTQTNGAVQIDNVMSMSPAEEYLVFEDSYNDNENGYGGESEDSNSESNWRNNYPDSEHSDDSVGENDIRNAMKNLNVDDELSSDDSDLVYGLDEDDVERYGHKYAKYKARMKIEKREYDSSINPNSDISEDEDEEDEDDEDDEMKFDENDD